MEIRGRLFALALGAWTLSALPAFAATPPDSEDPRALATALNADNIRDAQTLFADLRACYQALEGSGDTDRARALAALLSGWNETTYLLEDGTEFRYDQLLAHRNLDAQLPIEVASHVVSALEDASERIAPVCKVGARSSVGSAKFDAVFGSILGAAGGAEGMALRSAYGLVSVLGLENVGALIEWAPDAVTERMPFVQADWFQAFLARLLQEPRMGSSLDTLLTMDGDRLTRLSSAAYAIARPYQIRYSYLPDANHVVPFVHHNAATYFRRPDVLACMGRAADEIHAAKWQGRNVAAVHGRLLRELGTVCPELSFRERLFMLTIQDRTAHQILPTSIRKIIATDPDLISVTGDEPDGHVFRRDQSRERLLAARYGGAERFSRLIVEHLYPVPFNHVAAPAALRCELLATTEFTDEEVRAIVYTFGVGYQVLDARTKAAAGLSTTRITEQALGDLHLWDGALSRPCED